jgi:hypothetical protein
MEKTPWILQHNTKVIGEYRYLMQALDKIGEYFPNQLIFDFEIYFRETNGDLSKVPLM